MPDYPTTSALEKKKLELIEAIRQEDKNLSLAQEIKKLSAIKAAKQKETDLSIFDNPRDIIETKNYGGKIGVIDRLGRALSPIDSIPDIFYEGMKAVQQGNSGREIFIRQLQRFQDNTTQDFLSVITGNEMRKKNRKTFEDVLVDIGGETKGQSTMLRGVAGDILFAPSAGLFKVGGTALSALNKVSGGIGNRFAQLTSKVPMIERGMEKLARSWDLFYDLDKIGWSEDKQKAFMEAYRTAANTGNYTRLKTFGIQMPTVPGPRTTRMWQNTANLGNWSQGYGGEGKLSDTLFRPEIARIVNTLDKPAQKYGSTIIGQTIGDTIKWTNEAIKKTLAWNPKWKIGNIIDGLVKNDSEGVQFIDYIRSAKMMMKKNFFVKQSPTSSVSVDQDMRQGFEKAGLFSQTGPNDAPLTSWAGAIDNFFDKFLRGGYAMSRVRKGVSKDPFELTQLTEGVHGNMSDAFLSPLQKGVKDLIFPYLKYELNQFEYWPKAITRNQRYWSNAYKIKTGTMGQDEKDNPQMAPPWRDDFSITNWGNFRVSITDFVKTATMDRRQIAGKVALIPKMFAELVTDYSFFRDESISKGNKYAAQYQGADPLLKSFIGYNENTKEAENRYPRYFVESLTGQVLNPILDFLNPKKSLADATFPSKEYELSQQNLELFRRLDNNKVPSDGGLVGMLIREINGSILKVGAFNAQADTQGRPTTPKRTWQMPFTGAEWTTGGEAPTSKPPSPPAMGTAPSKKTTYSFLGAEWTVPGRNDVTPVEIVKVSPSAVKTPGAVFGSLPDARPKSSEIIPGASWEYLAQEVAKQRTSQIKEFGNRFIGEGNPNKNDAWFWENAPKKMGTPDAQRNMELDFKASNNQYLAGLMRKFAGPDANLAWEAYSLEFSNRMKMLINAGFGSKDGKTPSPEQIQTKKVLDDAYQKSRPRGPNEPGRFNQGMLGWDILGEGAYDIAYNRYSDNMSKYMSSIASIWEKMGDTNIIDNIVKKAQAQIEGALVSGKAQRIDPEVVAKKVTAIQAVMEHQIEDAKLKTETAIVKSMESWVSGLEDSQEKIEMMRQIDLRKYIASEDAKLIKANKGVEVYMQELDRINAKYDNLVQQRKAKDAQIMANLIEANTKSEMESMVASLKAMFDRGGMTIEDYYNKLMAEQINYARESGLANVRAFIEQTKMIPMTFGVTMKSDNSEQYQKKIENVIVLANTLEDAAQKIADLKLPESVKYDITAQTKTNSLQSMLDKFPKEGSVDVQLKSLQEMKTEMDRVILATDGGLDKLAETDKAFTDFYEKLKLSITGLSEQMSAAHVQLNAAIVELNKYSENLALDSAMSMSPYTEKSGNLGGMLARFFGKDKYANMPQKPLTYDFDEDDRERRRKDLKESQAKKYSDAMSAYGFNAVPGFSMQKYGDIPGQTADAYITDFEKAMATIQSTDNDVFGARTENARQYYEQVEQMKKMAKNREIETSNLALQLDTEYWDKKLSMATQVTSGLLQLTALMYESSGKHSKSAFYAMKAVAIADATVHGALAIVKALSEGPYIGPVLAAITAASVGAQIGVILAQDIGGKAEGGIIEGGSGAKDDVPIMAMGGEYVIRQSSVNKYGTGMMEAINRGLFDAGNATFAMPDIPTSHSRHYADGGPVKGFDATADDPMKPGGNSMTIINVIDPSEMDRYLASAKGQNAILNVLSSKSNTVRKVLG